MFLFSASNAQEVVIGENTDGRVTVRATRFEGEINIDGELDESIYETIAPISDFIQNIPTEGAPASERTEVWVFYNQIVPRSFFVRPRSGTDMQCGGTQTSSGSRSGAGHRNRA